MRENQRISRSRNCRRALRIPIALGIYLTLVSALGFAQSLGELHDAARDGDAVAIRALLSAGADPDSRAVDGTTALHWAAQADSLGSIEALLAAGGDADAADRYGVRPAYLAAVNGSAEALSMLMDAGARIDVMGPNGDTLLMTAARTGSTEAISLLVERGVGIDAADTEFEQTALMLAVREDHAEAVALLLSLGAEPDRQTRIGSEPQFVPPCKGTGCGSEGVGINRGGLPDRGRRNARLGGMTPLLYAARDGHEDITALLISGGADIELPEANGITPLLMAILNNRPGIARALLDAGADPNVDDFWGRTPLFAAVEYRNLDMNNREEDSPTDNGVDRAPLLDLIGLLIDRGADVNARTREVPPSRRWLYSLNDVSWVDFTGQTPFLRAALSGDTDTMRLLLAHGADPNLPTFAGTTPLMAAAGVNWVVAQTYTVSPEALLEAVAMCLELGADINATNSMGLTALLGAANRGSDDIIRYLVEHGARLDIVDAHDRSPIRWAEGVFLAAVGAERKPSTIALLEELIAEQSAR